MTVQGQAGVSQKHCRDRRWHRNSRQGAHSQWRVHREQPRGRRWRRLVLAAGPVGGRCDHPLRRMIAPLAGCLCSGRVAAARRSCGSITLNSATAVGWRPLQQRVRVLPTYGRGRCAATIPMTGRGAGSAVEIWRVSDASLTHSPFAGCSNHKRPGGVCVGRT